MTDIEYRIAITRERGHLEGCAIYGVAENGQWFLVGAREAGPFDTLSDVVLWALRLIRRDALAEVPSA